MIKFSFKKYISISFVFLISIFCAFADEPSVFCKNLANSLDFPVELLTEKDMTKIVQKKHGGLIIAALQIKDKNNCFAPISLCIASAGSLLKKEQREKFEKSLADNPSLASDHKVQVEGMADGFIYYGAGPGGSETIIVLNMPSKKIDILFKITESNEPVITRTDETKEYDKLRSTGRLEGTLIEFSRTIISNLYNNGGDIREAIGLPETTSAQ